MCVVNIQFFYLMHRSRGVSMDDIVKAFTKNRVLNDVRVYKFVARVFPKVWDYVWDRLL